MQFLADMNISPKTVEVLQSLGWDIVRVSSLISFDASDQEILQLSRKQNRVLVTQDLDFSALLALGGHSRPSVITLRLSVADPETVTQKLLKAIPTLEDDLSSGCIVTLQDRAIRIRRLPIKI